MAYAAAPHTNINDNYPRDFYPREDSHELQDMRSPYNRPIPAEDYRGQFMDAIPSRPINDGYPKDMYQREDGHELQDMSSPYNRLTQTENYRGQFMDAIPSRPSNVDEIYPDEDYEVQSNGNYQEQLIRKLPSYRLNEALSKNSDGTMKPRSATVRRRKTKRSRSLMYKTVRMRQNTTCKEILQKLENDSLVDEGFLTQDGAEALSAMPVNLSSKRAVMGNLTDTLKAKEKTLSYDVWFRSIISVRWSGFQRRLQNMAYYVGLWESAIKKVKGLFGSGVTSYFLFLKWLFLLNIVTFFLMFLFLILPQLLYRFLQMEPSGYKSNSPFEISNIFNGKGWMSNTEMFYGFYTNRTITISSGAFYLMPYAYFYSLVVSYLIILSALFYSIARSYKVNFIEATTESNYYFVTKIFSAWDHSMTSKDAVAFRHKTIYNEIKEHLSEFDDFNIEEKFSNKFKIYFSRFLSHIVVLSMIAGSGYFVLYLIYNLKDKIGNEILRDFSVPVTISTSNLVLSLIFIVITHLESYEHPQTDLIVVMFRTAVLSITNLSMLCYCWVTKVIKNDSIQCWETVISQEIYRLVIVDFFFTLLYTLVFEVSWFLLSFTRIIKTTPKFNIATTTLDLVYSQALCWLGLFYAPLMSLLMVVKLFLIFYIKWISVVLCCSPPKMIWRASRTHTIFLSTLLLYFVLTVVAVAISIFYNKPSDTCGPFSGLESAYTLVSLMITQSQSSNSFLKKIVVFISQRGFIFVVLIIFCVVAYYSNILLVSHRKMVKLLKFQLDLEGKNKQFLLTLMNKARQTNDGNKDK
ncbi:transmembrane channel-like protein 5 [Argonauta hians]